MTPDLSTLTLSTAIEALRRREFSSLELTEACLRQVERLNPTLSAFITPTPELACQAAMQADVLIGLQPPDLKDSVLLGLPIALKDLFNTAGVRTTAGTKFFDKNIPAEDAEAVRRVKQAGAVVIGKTNTHEIALGVTGVNLHYGVARNPHNPDRITGGSSSGSAVAVETGMCLAALGTDTGGSIRIPASLCGVVGLKPTYGRVSTRGVFPLSWNLDHVGPLARTVRDAALMLSVLAGFDPGDPASADIPAGEYLAHLEDGIRGWRVAMAAGEYIEACDPEVLKTFVETAALFEKLGARVEKVEMDWLKESALANGQMTQADGATVHRERMAGHPDWFGADVLQRLRTGAALTSSEYSLARRAQAEARRRFELFFKEYDLLVLPTTPIPAPPIEGTGAIEAARQLTRFTAPFNLTGLPALSIPRGKTSTGLPIGLQIVAGHWREDALLRAGTAVEKEIRY